MKITKLLLLFLISFLPIAIHAQSEKISGNFFKIADTVEINQEVEGDVMVLAGTLTINAKVGGDVLAIAENMEINADIGGDLRVAAKNLDINAKVAKNTNVLAASASVGKVAELGKDIYISSREFKTNGAIGGNLKGNFTNAEIGGNINGNADITLEEYGKLVIYPDSSIGNLRYRAKEPTQIPAATIIKGGVEYNELPSEAEKINYFGKIISLFSMIALGMAILFLDKKNTISTAKEIISHPNKSFFYGLLYFLAMPIVAILLMFTIIGMPIALILLAIYAILIYVSQVIAGIALGTAATGKKLDRLWSMILGLTVLIILASLPWIGGAFRVFAILIGMGGIINVKKRRLKESNI